MTVLCFCYSSVVNRDFLKTLLIFNIYVYAFTMFIRIHSHIPFSPGVGTFFLTYLLFLLKIAKHQAIVFSGFPLVHNSVLRHFRIIKFVNLFHRAVALTHSFQKNVFTSLLVEQRASVYDPQKNDCEQTVLVRLEGTWIPVTSCLVVI